MQKIFFLKNVTDTVDTACGDLSNMLKIFGLKKVANTACQNNRDCNNEKQCNKSRGVSNSRDVNSETPETEGMPTTVRKPAIPGS
jgi:hypothetical protein